MNNNLKTKLQNFFDMELNASIEYILCGCIAKDNLGNMVSKYIDLFSKECIYEINQMKYDNLLEDYHISDDYCPIDLICENLKYQQEWYIFTKEAIKLGIAHKIVNSIDELF